MKKNIRLRTKDTVVVISGKHAGSVGKIRRILREDEKVIVEGVNKVKRHIKATQDRPGTIVEKEAPIHISNVAYWNAAEGRRVKIGYSFVEEEQEIDGAVQTVRRKVRVDRKSGAVLG